MLNIPIEYGRQTVGIVTVTTSDDAGYLGMGDDTRSVALMSGVRFRPLRTDEVNGEIGTATGMWKLTAPVEVAAMAAQSTGEIVYDGTATPVYDEDDDSNLYHIEGFAQPKPDMYGQIHHVTIFCKKQAT